MRGFTLIELLIVIALGSLALGAMILFGSQIVATQELERAEELIRSELAAAQADSMAGTMDASWGVAFFPNYIVRFNGSSFASRIQAYDRTTNFSNALLISGPSEVAFSRINGKPQTEAIITLTLNNRTATVTVGAAGSISAQ